VTTSDGLIEWQAERVAESQDPDPLGRRRWDVALSYDTTHRSYVSQVADALRTRGVACFYDEEEQVGLWGKYLTEELPRIYGEDAAAVVVFVSSEYMARDWTRLERRVALSTAIRERGEYILPARFDDTVLPGALSDMVAVDLRQYKPAAFANLVVDKLVAMRVLRGAPSAGREKAAESPRKLFAHINASAVDMIEIPSGEAIVKLPEHPSQTFLVEAFAVSKYPITESHFRDFVEDESGYADPRWQDGLHLPFDATDLTVTDNSPLPAVVMRSEAIAYCRWFSVRNQVKLALPTIAHWMRAARGSSTQRYPWGNDFARTRCHCGARRRLCAAVWDHPEGRSMWGVEDLVGNCPEWINIFPEERMEWENSGYLHNWGTWADSQDHLSYTCEYAGDWSVPTPWERAGFRVCTMSTAVAR
jgi:formylglycine-generating enzyme required for sulfatase activity